MRDIGQRIKELREQKCISQKDLADAIGVKQHTISEYENDKKRPSYEVLVLFVKFFSVTAGQLIGTEDL
ncbi:MAG: helix-turn-helix domain-containing protein [Firmicutes bacterium]|nr:helix-turn-helix domain-containing protein [Bacillota bacterium]